MPNMMVRPRRVLVTGHTGFIGQALTRTLDADGIAWIGAARSNGCDLSCPGALADVPPCDVVVHLAALKGVVEAWENPGGFYRTNLMAAVEVMEFARRHGARVVNLSTYVYGEPQYVPVDECHPVSCRNPYAWSKRAVEVLCEGYASDFGLSAVSLRLFNTYGVGQPTSWLVSYVIAQALSGDTVALDTLTPRRDFLWIDDVVSAVVAVIRQPLSGYHVFNLGSGTSRSNLDVVEAVTRILGPRRVVDLGKTRPGEISDCVCDAAAFRRTFGWSPAMPFDEGIARLVEVMRSTGHT